MSKKKVKKLMALDYHEGLIFWFFKDGEVQSAVVERFVAAAWGPNPVCDVGGKSVDSLALPRPHFRDRESLVDHFIAKEQKKIQRAEDVIKRLRGEG